jgi:hypothetical protein
MKSAGCRRREYASAGLACLALLGFFSCSVDDEGYTYGSGASAGASDSHSGGEPSEGGAPSGSGSGGTSDGGEPSGATGGTIGGAAGETGSGGTTDALLTQGEACTRDGECESGTCSDGVCCDSSCDGPCRACAEEYTGAADGVCRDVIEGADPDDDCEASEPETCGDDGTCDGEGGCRKHGTNQECAASSCAGSTFTPARTCDGAGACEAATSMACGDSPCSEDGCQTPCGEDADCPSGTYCAGSVCRNKGIDGSACSAPSHCRSDYCVDGVCCASECSLSCQACSNTTTGLADGICGTRTNSATKPCPTNNPTACVDLETSTSHCGQCGNECPAPSVAGASAVCSDGLCSAACPEGTLGDGVNVCLPVTTLQDVGAGMCGLRTNGQLQCWGDLSGGFDPEEAGLSDTVFTSLSSTTEFACGIRDDGRAICWGPAAPAQRPGPFIAIDAGRSHVCGIKSDRTLDCWPSADSISPPPSGRYKGIASGVRFSCAIVAGGAADGQLTCWGSAATDGGLSFPDSSETFSQVFAGNGPVGCGLRPNGTARCFGMVRGTPPTSVFETLEAGGGEFICGILTNGSATCWTWNIAPFSLSGQFKALAHGLGSVCGVRSNGQVDCVSDGLGGTTVLESQDGPFQGYW